MRWQGGRASRNVQDRRGTGGGGIGIPLGKGGLGCGGLILVLVIAYFTGINPLALLGAGGGGGPAPAPTNPDGTPPQDTEGQFVSKVLGFTEETWSEIFQRQGQTYREPGLVLFEDATPTGCGMGSSAVGPFYCPADQSIYLDLDFYDALSQRFGAEGDFARAYVIAHEVGHHVQNQLGIAEAVRSRQQRSSRADANQLSVMMELQADCLAGVWGASHRDLLEPGDVEEGLNAAAAIGDDMMQRRSGQGVQPESWTHGSSQQRAEWLRRGLETGDPDACDTFGGSL